MKVIVRCAHNRVTKADMEREIERLFQENKDLRLSESQLRDELRIVSQQSEVRRQKMVEKDALIDELNDQITACEEELTETNKTLEKKSAALAQVSAQRDNFEASYKQVCEWWGNEQTKARQMTDEYAKLYQEKEKAENVYLGTIAELHSELNDRDARVDELEKRVEWLENEHIEKIADERDLYIRKYTEMKSDRNHLRDEVERLTYERDTAVKGNSELVDENIELRDNLDAVINIKNEYAEIIDEMRKKIVQMQSPEFTNHLAKLILECFPSTGK